MEKENRRLKKRKIVKYKRKYTNIKITMKEYPKYSIKKHSKMQN